MFLNHLADAPFFYFSWITIVMFSICVHEYAHAYTALRLGDDTAARAGHLTLNPLVQMGSTSLIFLLLIGIAWGSVPVSIQRFREKWAGAVVAFAGPASNLVLSFLFTLGGGIASLIIGDTMSQELTQFFLIGAVANGVLFVLNMLPVPMLDGWSVFSYFFPQMGRVEPGIAQHISLVALLLIFLTPLRSVIWDGGSAVAGVFNAIVFSVLG